MEFESAVQVSHRLVKERLRPDSIAIDATAGNGHDTVFLAGIVGEGGKVIAYDVQSTAIESTRQRLETAELSQRVELRRCGHEHLGDAEHPPSSVGAIMFNLGYLPHGDKSIITRPDTTLAALEQGLVVLARGGIITLVCYTGHVGGAQEAAAVETFSRGLDPTRFEVLRYGIENLANHPPHLIAIAKRSTG